MQGSECPRFESWTAPRAAQHSCVLFKGSKAGVTAFVQNVAAESRSFRSTVAVRSSSSSGSASESMASDVLHGGGMRGSTAACSLVLQPSTTAYSLVLHPSTPAKYCSRAMQPRSESGVLQPTAECYRRALQPSAGPHLVLDPVDVELVSVLLREPSHRHSVLGHLGLQMLLCLLRS